MRERYLEITFRKGKPIAAYLYLPRSPQQKSVKTEKITYGLLIDYDAKGQPIGIEITAPRQINMEAINGELSVQSAERFRFGCWSVSERIVPERLSSPRRIA